MNNEILSYIAGAVDISSTFYICRSLNKDLLVSRYQAGIQLTHNDRNVLLFIQDHIGGQLVAPRINSSRACWKILVRNYQISNLINLIRPFLRVKIKHADILLTFRETFHYQEKRKYTKGNPEIPQDILDKREECYYELQKLNNENKPLSQR